MLDDVERRTFLVQPAREDPLPGSVGLGNVELDKCPREALIFPRRGGIASAQADDGIAHADRLAGFERDIADDAVALVEQPKHRDALAHRGHPRDRLDRPWHIDGHGLGAIDGLVGAVRAAITARAKRYERQQDEAARQGYSGFHA